MHNPATTASPENIGEAAVLERLLHQRYSCRAYLSDPVPGETIERILTLAQRTASWCNTQPWNLVITSGSATARFREALLADVVKGNHAPDFPFPREYIDEYLARRRECGMQLYDSLGIARQDREARRRQELRNFEFFDAPHVAIVSAPESLGVYGAVDCGAFVSNFMLAARAHGVAAIAQAALAMCSPFIRDYFSLDPSLRVVCGISFGYADDTHPVNRFRTRRETLSANVRFDF